MCGEMSRRPLTGTFKLSETSPFSICLPEEMATGYEKGKRQYGEKVNDVSQVQQSVSSKYNLVRLCKSKSDVLTSALSHRRTISGVSCRELFNESALDLYMLVNNRLAGCHRDKRSVSRSHRKLIHSRCANIISRGANDIIT